MQLVTVSPKGQITIPKSARKELQNKHLLFEMQGTTIILRPITIQYDDVEIEDFVDSSVEAGEPNVRKQEKLQQPTISASELREHASIETPITSQSPSFDFWNNPLDDIYEKFYASTQSVGRTSASANHATQQVQQS